MKLYEEQDEKVSHTTELEEKIVELDEGHARSDPGKTPESRPPPDNEKMDEDQAGSNPGKIHVALAGPNPEPMHEDFMATVYPNVHESLKLPADEQVILEDPLSSSGTLSLMKNLDDTYTFGDQFLNDKSTKDEPGKLNMEAEVVSMVTVPIYQADSFAPPLSTLVLKTTSLISSSPPVHPPIITETTMTASTTPALPPPPPTQSTTNPELVARLTALEKRNAELEHAFTIQNKTTNNLAFRIFTLEHRDLEYNINSYVHETVKENVQIALRAPLLQSFRDLSEIEMKEMLQQRMFKSGSFKSLPEYVALYEALENSMDHTDRRKQKKHDSGAFASQQPPVQTSSAWTTTNTRDTPSSSSKKQSVSHSEQPTNDIPTPDEGHISDSDDHDNAYVPNIKPRAEWLKLVLDDERPATPEPTWVIPTSYIPDAVNNWANALATTYQAPAENSLFKKTRDMQTFMNWYCQKVGKTELTQADFEGQAYEVIKPFYPDVIHLQFQMEECHKMLTNQIDWANPEGDQVRIDISRPLPLSVTPGHVTIQTQFFFNEDLDYLRYGSKGSRPTLLISKMKAAHYLDFGLELLVPEHMWINDVCTYDISASYGISHWWFNHQKLYINRHTAESRRKAVRTHMHILSVFRIKAYSRYGYDYLKGIVLRRADYQEYTIAEKDFKNLYPSDFKDLNLLLLQGHLNHLAGSDKHMLSTAIKLWTCNLVIRQRVEDLQLGIESY
ncbi:hypothetical protein Tco_0381801 [Tanacetum coccineum]